MERSALLALAKNNAQNINDTDVFVWLHSDLETAQEIGNLRECSDILNSLGELSKIRGKYQNALSYFQSSLEISIIIGNQRMQSKATTFIAEIHATMQNFAQSIDCQQKVIAIKKDIGDIRQEKNLMRELGETYRKWGDYIRKTKLTNMHEKDYLEILDYQQRSAEILREVDDPWGESMSLASLGMTCYVWGAYEKAVDYYHKSLAVSKTVLHSVPDSGNIHPQHVYFNGVAAPEKLNLTGIAAAYLAWKNYPKAIEYYKKVLSIVRSNKNSQEEVSLLITLGDLYTKLGDYNAAIVCNQQHLDIVQQNQY
ncbi:tetratricopeptide repeat protein [Leptothoe spongobia]|uniref:Tetratricopeptide repeat protein n=1 Tax=Leptothoe spongobia TAU-MAC 1115 TaxID=1967444 RepID=A0A947GP93_9CYAN|nr:tetratricopeptide repeat protein [Leptothoe spongobia]MBT9316436.1 tetratricopeptide repeat protein [Leptothoe spongobia TAU-MAC 1115]